MSVGSAPSGTSKESASECAMSVEITSVRCPRSAARSAVAAATQRGWAVLPEDAVAPPGVRERRAGEGDRAEDPGRLCRDRALTAVRSARTAVTFSAISASLLTLAVHLDVAACEPSEGPSGAAEAGDLEVIVVAARLAHIDHEHLTEKRAVGCGPLQDRGALEFAEVPELAVVEFEIRLGLQRSVEIQQAVEDERVRILHVDPGRLVKDMTPEGLTATSHGEVQLRSSGVDEAPTGHERVLAGAAQVP